MSLIQLKFAPEMETAIIEGRKCCTSRSEKKGNVGDLFIVERRLFRIVHIHRASLHSIRDAYYDAEGFDSPVDFENFWDDHCGEFSDVLTTYLHFFSFVGRVCENGFRSGDRCLALGSCEAVKECKNDS